MEDKKITDLKKKINNLIWCNCPRKTTLDEAESIAIKILAMIINGEVIKEAE